MTDDPANIAFYLVKDGDRITWLAAVLNHSDRWAARAYVYVPDLTSFILNKPLTLDFTLDRELTYEPLAATTAAEMISAGHIQPLAEANRYLLETIDDESDRIPLETALPNTRGRLRS